MNTFKRTIYLLISFSLFSLYSYSQTYSFGVNLAGAEFGSNYMDDQGILQIDVPGTIGQQYIYPNEAELDYYHSKGLDLIRMPFIWERVQDGFFGDLNTENMAAMHQVIAWAHARNMQILLDFHNYGRYVSALDTMIIGDNNLPVSYVVDVWTKLANEFKNDVGVWGYGIMNEPHDMLNSTPWVDIAQAIITGIRSVDVETTIIVGGDRWSSAEHWLAWSDNLKNLIDPSDKLIFEAHVYFDNDASGFYGGSYAEEMATPNTGVERATPFVDWLQANNLRGFIGEYGIPDNDAAWMVTLDNMLTYLEQNCVNGTYWAGGSRWGNDFMAINPVDATGESDPLNGTERPQMAIVGAHTMASNNCQVIVPTIPVTLYIHAMLQGAYSPIDQLMRDDLRAGNYLPLTEPYTDLGFAHFQGGGEQTTASVFTDQGSNSIVDWIFIELRDGQDPTTKIATKTALIQRDGDVVDLDGFSDVVMTINESYTDVLVVLRHRNHFGLRTMNSYATNDIIEVDFASGLTPVFNEAGRQNVNGITVMIAGDANNDGQINTVDRNNHWRIDNGNPYQYIDSRSDFNMDGIVNGVDRNNLWRVNNPRIGGLD